jgi:hypothetical protein
VSLQPSRAKYAETLDSVVNDREEVVIIERLESGGRTQHELVE